jgi:hypothetical protein
VGLARSSSLRLHQCFQISSRHSSVPGVGIGGIPTPFIQRRVWSIYAGMDANA